jgi:hypothetical protein
MTKETRNPNVEDPPCRDEGRPNYEIRSQNGWNRHDAKGAKKKVQKK